MDLMTPDGDVKTERLGLCIDAALVTKLNLADFQNAVPMLRELSITSASQEDARDLELRIESHPPFVKPKLWHIDALAAGSDRRITDLDVQLDGALLTRLTEAETAIVTLSLCSRDAGSTALAKLERGIELLPRNQWGGTNTASTPCATACCASRSTAAKRASAKSAASSVSNWPYCLPICQSAVCSNLINAFSPMNSLDQSSCSRTRPVGAAARWSPSMTDSDRASGTLVEPMPLGSRRPTWLDADGVGWQPFAGTQPILQSSKIQDSSMQAVTSCTVAAGRLFSMPTRRTCKLSVTVIRRIGDA